jgi:hypothetical protein
MRTSLPTLCALVVSMGTALATAQAAPGDGMPQPGVVVLEQARSACMARRSVCLRPGSPTTAVAPSLYSAAQGSHAAAGLPPRFARLGTVAGLGQRSDLDDQIPWTLDVGANLQTSALPGNAVFLVYDAADPEALARREVVRAWQVQVPAGPRLSARVTLSPNDGFRAGHTYRIRIVQLVRGKEVVLSDAPVQLL